MAATLLTEAQRKAKLIIDPPDELHFRGPFNKGAVTPLKLTNPSDEYIMFKIKTTAPKRYCVRPNYGLLQPHESTNVEICLQPFTFDLYDKIKHKFMIQSIVCQDGNPDDYMQKYSSMWKDLPPDNFMDAKLRCVFDLPPENVETANAKAITMTESSSSPKSKAEEKISNLEASEQTTEILASELRQLREENSNLKKELLNLKEQVMRVRTTTAKAPIAEPYAPVAAEKQIPIFYIALAFAAVVLGIILGKMIF